MPGPSPPDGANNDRFHSPDLYFYIEKPVAITIEDVFQTRGHLMAVAALPDLSESMPPQDKLV